MSVPREEELAEENWRLRQEIQAWQSQAQGWQSEKQALQTQVQELENIRRNLEHTVAVYKRCLFGSRSEKIDPQELEARIAQAAAEAREQLAQEKRPGDPPPEAEEEKPEAKADTPADPADPTAGRPADQEQEPKRKARPHGRGGFPAHLPRRRIEHAVDPAQALCAGCADHPPLI
jgi:chromosome segregation ATPase